MSPVEALREFINVRLTAAAGEIFSEFQQTIVQYQEEIQTQRRLLEISRKESTQSPTTDNSQKHSCIEEQLWNKQRNCSLGQEEPEHPEIEEEQKEPKPPQDKEGQVLSVVKQEAVTIMMTVTDDKSEHRDNQDSPESVREFINVRLTAAAGEIFSEFQQTIVQYQEEIQTQRRLLEITLNPQIKRHRLDVPEHRVCTEQQFWNQEMNSSLYYKLKPPQIKEEEEEIWTSQEEEKLVLKHEVDTIMMNSTGELSELEPDSEALLSMDSVVAGTQHQLRGQIKDSGSTEQAELNANRSCSKNVDDFLLTPQSFLSANMTSHTSKGSQSSEICGKAFSQQSSLLVHMKTHTGERPHSCLICGKGFIRNQHLLDHMRTHTDEKPYPCVICGKHFNVRSNVSVHMRTHTGERPYSCQTCGKSFSQKVHLSDHNKVHTGERPHSCVTCGKRFIGKGDLLVHMRGHTGEKPYSCETCGKRFSRKGHLTEHNRFHTGERRYSCVTCGQLFFTSSHLKVHMRHHTDEMPHSCVTCGKSFFKKWDLSVHMMTHTSEKPHSFVTW